MEIICREFYNNNLKEGLEFSDNENLIAYEILKSLTQNIWSDKIMSNEQKLEYFNGYNIDNLRNILCSIIEFYRLNKIDKYIPMRDLTLLPSTWLFINQHIKSTMEANKNIIKIFKTQPIFSTGNFKLGYQEGFINSKGTPEITSMKASEFEIDKTYILISTLETIDEKSTKKNIFIDYYLGNISFN